jgi:hypothetical protein
MLGETQKPILPHPRSAQYKRARKKQILITDELLGLLDRPNRATNEDLVGGNTDDDLNLGKRAIRLDRQVAPQMGIPQGQ